jgi:hypothetical protein
MWTSCGFGVSAAATDGGQELTSCPCSASRSATLRYQTFGAADGFGVVAVVDDADAHVQWRAGRRCSAVVPDTRTWLPTQGCD